MTMFPGPDAVVDYNEAREPTGWDYPTDDADSFYCDFCGFNHQGACPDDTEEDDDSGYTDACEDISCTCGHPECGAC